TIILWDVASHKPLGQPLTGHTGFVESIAFSPDGKTLASASLDNTIILWDVDSHNPLGQPLTGHNGFLESIAFSPDAKTPTWAILNNTIILWDVNFESWQSRACRIANRNLTRVEWKEYIGDIESYRATCPEFPVEPEILPEAQAKIHTPEN